MSPGARRGPRAHGPPLVALVGVVGKHLHGHSSDHWERKKAHDKLNEERVMERMLREDANLIGQYSTYMSPEQLAAKRRQDAILARVALGARHDMGCIQTEECDRQGRCKKCKEWAMFMAPVLDHLEQPNIFFQ